MAGALAEVGLRRGEVLASAGLSAGLLDVPGAYVPVADYFALWGAIGRVSGDPNVGLRLGRAVKAELTEPLFLAILSCETLARALETVCAYKRVLSSEDFRLEVDEAAGRWTLASSWPEGVGEPPPALVDAEFAFLVEAARRGTGAPDLSPCDLALRAPALPPGAQHAAFFRCEVRLGAKANALAFAARDAARPFVTHNPPMLSALLPYLEGNPAAAAPAIERVRDAIAAQLRGRRPTLRSVSRGLAMSTRALQRLLQEEGTSFRGVLDEVRNRYARGYLSATAFTDAEVAFLLGFEDPNSFYRAFRTWNGTSPGEFRRAAGAS
ncbi:MAG TPA: AraC family transcriptional regulator ligand-binding domain-containing protein [Polyangiaceae bacterium]|nr:AraC family transcriptional regulator ligand-binding domain-containing protein [Polyangiaceae bacterium]